MIGSVLFLSGSVLYLWDFEAEEDRQTVYCYLGLQFMLGSVLFLVGGIMNLYRAYLIFKFELSKLDLQSKEDPETIAEYHKYT